MPKPALTAGEAELVLAQPDLATPAGIHTVTGHLARIDQTLAHAHNTAAHLDHR